MTHTNTEALSDLLPCPFCGGEGAYQTDTEEAISDEEWIGCLECGATTALEVWNRRSASNTGRVEVKALSWRKLSLPIQAEAARTAFGDYRVGQRDDGRGWYAFLEGQSHLGPFASCDQAKAAAQADFNQRILSAISLAAEAEPVAEPMGYVSTTTLAYLKAGIASVACSIYAVPVSIHNIPLYTRSSPVSAEVTVTDEMLFAAMKRADELDVIFDDIDGREILAAALLSINGGRENG